MSKVKCKAYLKWTRYEICFTRGSEDPTHGRKSSMSSSLLVPATSHHPTLTTSLETVVVLGKKLKQPGWSADVAAKRKLNDR